MNSSLSSPRWHCRRWPTAGTTRPNPARSRLWKEKCLEQAGALIKCRECIYALPLGPSLQILPGQGTRLPQQSVEVLTEMYPAPSHSDIFQTNLLDCIVIHISTSICVHLTSIGRVVVLDLLVAAAVLPLSEGRRVAFGARRGLV